MDGHYEDVSGASSPSVKSGVFCSRVGGPSESASVEWTVPLRTTEWMAL